MKTITRLSTELKKGYIQSFSQGEVTYRFNRMSLTFERIEQNKVTGSYKRLSDALTGRNQLKEVVPAPKRVVESILSKDDELLLSSVQYVLKQFEAPIANLRNLIQSMYHFKLYNYGNR